MTSQEQIVEGPASKLVGLTLTGGWKVVSRHNRPADATGGKYSICYDVERNTERAFLKALDFSRARDAVDFPRALQELTVAFNFERDILETCTTRGMDRVVTPLDSGEVEVDNSALGRVNYIIFEKADSDLRHQLSEIDQLNVTWRLRALHHIATGLYQLHAAGISHQDVKPSNVLQFGEISKISDLGCAAVRGKVGPMDDDGCPGTRAYAPPELLYNYLEADFTARRFGCDAYLLGSMAMFFFSGISTTTAILKSIDPAHHPAVWTGKFIDVLPYLRNAFGKAIQSLSAELTAPKLRERLVPLVAQLCDPDPRLRGHPKNRIGFGNPYSLERYVSAFNLLAVQSRLGRLG